MRHRDVLIEAIDQAIANNQGLTVTNIAHAAGVEPSTLMKFYRREQDVEVDIYFKVIEALPEPQRSFVLETMGITIDPSVEGMLSLFLRKMRSRENKSKRLLKRHL